MDSVGRIVSSMQATASYLGLPIPTENAVRDIIGLSLEPAIGILFGELSQSQFDAFMARYRDEYVDLNTTPTPLFEHALPMINQLREQQFVLAVATGKARRGLDRVWQESQVGHLFHASRCADESQGKPHPAMLHELMDELQFTPEQTLMLGDSVHDIGMAKAAGVAAFGVDFGVHDKARLQAAGAEQVISCLSDLPEAIKRYYE